MSVTKTMKARTRKKKKIETWTLAQRRAFLKLPMAERHRILAAQAAEIADHYNDPDAEWRELEVHDLFE
jgi:hypothetical protein